MRRWDCVLKNFVVLIWALAFGLPLNAQVTLSSAISLGEALKDISELMKQRGVEIKLGFAASGALARQIETGAPTDIFISADYDWIELLIDKGFIAKENARALIKNRLVLVSSAASNLKIEKIEDLLELGQSKIAIGDPAYVPAGKYAKSYLEAKGIYSALRPFLINATHAAQAISYVEKGFAQVGFVYQSDARNNRRIKRIFELEQKGAYQGAVYYAALINSKQSEEVLSVYDFLFSNEARGIFIQRGFKPFAENNSAQPPP